MGFMFINPPSSLTWVKTNYYFYQMKLFMGCYRSRSWNLTVHTSHLFHLRLLPTCLCWKMLTWMKNAQLCCHMKTRNHATWSKLTLKEKRTTVHVGLKSFWKLQRFGPLVTIGDCDEDVDWGVNLGILGILGNVEVILGNLGILLTRSWGRPRPTPALSFYSWARRRYSDPLFVGAASLSRGGEQLSITGVLG